MDNSKLEIDRNIGATAETAGVSRSPSDEPMDQVAPVNQLSGARVKPQATASQAKDGGGVRAEELAPASESSGSRMLMFESSESAESALMQMTPKKTTFDDNRDGKGTKEWSDFSYNICLGCEHECLYCYAKAMRCRFNKAMRVPGAWKKQRMSPNKKALGAEVGAKGVVMFPTTHDITPRFLRRSVKTIKNLLANNQVLIVSKPHLSVVRVLCKELTDHKDDILFRFTIGALSEPL